eukprot:NODE_11858_length_533_cov_25.131707_g11570_i0.p1 GENE.NODE_11858_length_533_cov_25.131707_g11570_i0~~NODE_11858_length_533_cov_25.131707_g11570_i0.p1  ORF type:complete len:135 (-),score=36.83 NODE_11858_length_533_cov_25.131707_g11570_i0:129-473(-)
MAEGSSESTEREYITLVSAEGCQFVIDKKAASISKMIAEMLEGCQGGPFGSVEQIPFPEIGAGVLDLVCQYLSERNNVGASMTEFRPLKHLDPKKEEDRQTVIELLLASNYLDC